MERKKFGNNGNRKFRSGGRAPRMVSSSQPYELPSAAKTIEEKLIVAALKRCGGDGVPAKSLLREAGIRDKDAFYDSLRSLKEAGEVEVDKDHWVKLSPHTGEVEATLVSLSEKFGFARPKVGTEDIFIPGSALKGAFVGDEILIGSLEKRDRGPSGRVKRIIKRSESAVTGTVHIGEQGGVTVTPDGPVRFDMRVLPGKANGAKDGDKVLITPLQDERGDWSQCEVRMVFGTGHSARVCADAIIERVGIPTVFPQEVMAQAEEIAKMTVTKEDIDSRLDLRDWPIFTIDSADAKDLDDAVSAEKTEYGYRLGVHIADVSH